MSPISSATPARAAAHRASLPPISASAWFERKRPGSQACRRGGARRGQRGRSGSKREERSTPAPHIQSLRAQRLVRRSLGEGGSNPECFCGDSLDCFVARAPRNDEIAARARRSTVTTRAACSDRPHEHAKARRTDDRLEGRIALLLGKDEAGLGISALGGLVADQERYRHPGKSSCPPLLQRMRDQ